MTVYNNNATSKKRWTRNKLNYDETRTIRELTSMTPEERII